MTLNISKFLEQFYMEADDRLSGIQSNMELLEQDPRNKAAIQSIQRDVHTIKGSSRMVGLKEISGVTHLMEDLFIRLSNEGVVSEETMSTLYRGMDGVSALLHAAKNKEPLPDMGPVLAELEVLTGKRSVPDPAPVKEAPQKEETGTKKFKLDFNSLKQKFKDKIPSVHKGKVKLPDDKDAPTDKDKSFDLVDKDKLKDKLKAKLKDKLKEKSRSPIKAGPQQVRQPHNKAPSKPPPAAPEAPEAQEKQEPAVNQAPPAPKKAGKKLKKKMVVKPTIQAAPVMEKAHLKVDGDRFDTIINQMTDLLSKRYFFNNVEQTYREMASMMRGLRDEVSLLKRQDFGINAKQDMVVETISNIDNTVELFLRKIQDYDRSYRDDLTNFEGSLRDVYDNLLDLKLTPLSTIFSIYPRFVRDYAYRNGKKIRIYVRGGDTQLDKTVIEKINEPLIHLIRNACDHGIESPEVREELGKPTHGTIIIEANKRGNRVEIKITDDGKGLDKERILKKAIEKKLVAPSVVQHLEEEEIFDFIFNAGFSTASAVSDTSGRGIGMDIVQKTTHRFGGRIDTISTKDKGTTFRLEFPVSIFTNNVTYVKEEGGIYALPCNLIRRIVKLKASDIKEKTDYSVVIHKDEIYTVVKLNQVLKGETTGIEGEAAFMIIPKVTDKKIGIIVDAILHESEAIIKDLGNFLGKRKYVYGMIIGDRGELHTVLDVHDLVGSEEFSRKIKIITPMKSKIKDRRRILVVDDSLLVREMERNLLQNAGYNVTIAINGLDGYNKALSERFDLVMADIEMPEMDGFEMIENIKKIEEYADVPTIVLSSVENEEDKVRGINLGVNAWLQKQDFHDREILKVIKSFIGGGK
ncbi:MAG: response regulator [bacterium]|nr:response regulator [bacterium]